MLRLMVEEHQIEPGVGVGPIRFGMTNAELVKLLGRPSSSTLRPRAGYDSLMWFAQGWKIGLVDDRVFEIEVFRDQGVKAMLGRVNLLGASGKRATEAVHAITADAALDQHGFMLESPSLGLRCGRHDNDRARWDSVCISDLTVPDSDLTERLGRAYPTDVLADATWAVSYEAVGPVAHGMRDRDVDAVLGLPDERHVGSAGPDCIRTSYGVVLVQLDHGAVSQVEVAGRLDRPPRLIYAGVDLARSPDAVLLELERAGCDIEPVSSWRVDVDGFISLHPGDTFDRATVALRRHVQS